MLWVLDGPSECLAWYGLDLVAVVVVAFFPLVMDILRNSSSSITVTLARHVLRRMFLIISRVYP